MAQHLDTISPEQAGSLAGVIIERIKRSPDAVAYRQFDKQTQAWFDMTWAEMGGHIARWQTALKNDGFVAGDRVGIMLRNCTEWVMMEQAALGLGLIVVPLYTNDRAENVSYMLQDAGIKLLLIEGGECWDLIKSARDDFGPVRRIVCLEKIDNPEDERITLADDWLPEHGDTMHTPDIYHQQLATIVYTSGTTGRPKGVMLSHRNILWNAYSSMFTVPVFREDLFLSFLPLSHMFERTVGHYIPIMAGSTVAYARSIPELAEDLRTIRPTVLITVPRIFERVYNKIQAGLEQKSPLARKLFHAAVETGWQKFEIAQGRAKWSARQLSAPILHQLVGKKVMTGLGGRMRAAISGGAPLSVDIARTFIGLGLNIQQGYGLTESSPVISCNKAHANDPASVGEPVRDVEARIGADDELLIRSPGVMLGYWNNEDATKEIIDKDGWLHTGDQVRIDSNHIYITGRLKEILVLANGEKVPPADVEMAIANDPLFEQSMVVGEGKSFLGAVVVLGRDQWQELASSLGLDPDAEDSLNDQRTKDALLGRIGNQIVEFPGYAKVYGVVATLRPWTVDDGLITPTLKLRRKQIMAQFQDQVDTLYAGR